MEVSFLPFKFSNTVNAKFSPFQFKGEVLMPKSLYEKCIEEDIFLKKPENKEESEKTLPVKLEKGQMLGVNGKVFNNSYTEIFRHDIKWNSFNKYLKERFNDFDKVNTYIYACSDGSEAYSISTALQSTFDDCADKFFPIYAKDIKEGLIEENKKEKAEGIELLNCENTRLSVYRSIKEGLDNNDEIINRFFEKRDNGRIYFSKTVTEPVEFSVANILDDVENIDSKRPSLFMCRNMWKYVDKNYHQEFADKLFDKLAPGSLVVIGGIDLDVIFPVTLARAGFKPVVEHNNNKAGFEFVFERNEEKNEFNSKLLKEVYGYKI